MAAWQLTEPMVALGPLDELRLRCPWAAERLTAGNLPPRRFRDLLCLLERALELPRGEPLDFTPEDYDAVLEGEGLGLFAVHRPGLAAFPLRSRAERDWWDTRAEILLARTPEARWCRDTWLRLFAGWRFDART